ncbi:hypothetical protein Tco_1050495, partial [Tanacetum coccineum]
MEILHISFQRVVDAGMFKGIALGPSLQLSHMIYADDAVFVGQWSDTNIDTIVHVLDCFHCASRMRINMNKIKHMGIYVEEDKVVVAVSKIGCLNLKTHFSYLGSKVGGLISDEGLTSIGIHSLTFFNGNDLHGNKTSWVKWEKVLASKEKGGLGVSSLHVLNRGLMLNGCGDIVHEMDMLKKQGIDVANCVGPIQSLIVP